MTFIRNKTIEQILIKHPNKIPIIITKKQGSTINELKKKKYLVSKDFTMGQFIWKIREYLNLNSSEAIFLFTNNTLIQTTITANELYQKQKNDDGILYIKYSSEEVFG